MEQQFRGGTMSQPADPPVGANTHVDQLISLHAKDVGGSCLVTVAGEVDMMTTPRLRSYLLEQLDRTESRLVIDLRQVGFLGSSGLAVLVEILEQADERGIGLRLVCDSREVVRPLTATGLTHLFDIYHDPEAALAS
jgi:anti-sigma B factor antagonist